VKDLNMAMSVTGMTNVKLQSLKQSFLLAWAELLGITLLSYYLLPFQVMFSLSSPVSSTVSLSCSAVSLSLVLPPSSLLGLLSVALNSQHFPFRSCQPFSVSLSPHNPPTYYWAILKKGLCNK